jgi:hypothetical protein
VSANEQKAKEKKAHVILYGVVIFVIGSTIMLFVGTIYNLVLAHIWPVTIHFGEYSFANVIYIMFSVLTSVIISYLVFYFAIFYILNIIFRGLFRFLLPPEYRARKRSRRERTADGLGFFFLLPLAVIGKWQEWRNPPAKSESAQSKLEKFQQPQSKNEENQQPH